MEQLAQKETELDEAEYREWLESYVPPVTQEPAPEIPESDSDWITPVSGYVLSSPFGMRMHPILGYERMHNGIDMACDEGTPIYASRGGVVAVADYQAGGAGNYVQIDHGDGYKSIYMHMTRYIVSPGQYVAPGQIIGYVGNTGLSKGNHLHFGISYNGTYVNPLEYIG
jgi:murein DD-endopeptidase MepM/ murein hydrolase activator NlpD